MPILPLAETAPAQTVFGFFTSGGVFMIPLVICSLISLTFILLRAFALRRQLVLPTAIEEEAERYRPGQPLERIRRTLAEDDSSLARILETAVRHREDSKSEAIEAVQTRARHEVVRLETGLVVLEVIIGIAPLLGLLGTVSGLVSVFANLGESGAAPDPRGIALGISEALNTTIAGLAIAIPSLIGHSYFSKKIEIMSVEMESIVGSLLEKLFRKTSPPPEVTHPPVEMQPRTPPSAQAAFPGGIAQPASPPAIGATSAPRKFEPTGGRPDKKNTPLQVRQKTFSHLTPRPGPLDSTEEAPELFDTPPSTEGEGPTKPKEA